MMSLRYDMVDDAVVTHADAPRPPTTTIARRLMPPDARNREFMRIFFDARLIFLCSAMRARLLFCAC